MSSPPTFTKAKDGLLAKGYITGIEFKEAPGSPKLLVLTPKKGIERAKTFGAGYDLHLGRGKVDHEAGIRVMERWLKKKGARTRRHDTLTGHERDLTAEWNREKCVIEYVVSHFSFTQS